MSNRGRRTSALSIPILALVFSVASSCARADDCLSELTSAPPAISPKAVYQRFSKLNPARGEYETTAQFQARIAAAGFPTSLVIAIPIPRSAGTFDADAGQLTFAGSDLGSAFSYVNLGGQVIGGYWLVAGSRVDHDGPSYIGENAFGAQTRVTSTNETVTGVALLDERMINIIEDNLHEHPGVDPYKIILSLPPAMAAKARENLEFVAIAVPVPPYLMRYDHTAVATFDLPLDLTSKNSAVIAPARCIGIRDAKTHQLLGAFPEMPEPAAD